MSKGKVRVCERVLEKPQHYYLFATLRVMRAKVNVYMCVCVYLYDDIVVDDVIKDTFCLHEILGDFVLVL